MPRPLSVEEEACLVNEAMPLLRESLADSMV